MNVTLLVVFPVTVDRSVTLYLLEQLAREASGLSKGEMRAWLVEQYLDEYGAVSRRMRRVSGEWECSRPGRGTLASFARIEVYCI